MPEDDDGDIDRAEHGKLMRLLEQSTFALEKGDAAIAVVANRLDGNFSATHGARCFREGNLESR